MIDKMTAQLQNAAWHPEAFLQNRYTRAYRQLVEWAQTQPRKKLGHAKHHIVPKSFYRSYCADGWIDGDHDDPSNLVILTHREHQWCHVLLALRMTEGLAKLKMSIAPHWMIRWLRKRGLEHRFCSRVLTSLDTNRVESISKLAVKRWAENTEWRDKVVSSLIATRNTPEYKSKAAETTKAYMANSDVRERHSKGMKLGNASAEAKSNRSVAAKRAMSDPIIKNRHVTAVREACANPEYRAKLSQLQRARFENLDVRAQLLEASVKAAEVNRDHCIYRWTHRDGRIFVGTRLEFSEYSGLTRDQCYPLFRSKPQKSAHGWCVSKCDKELL